MCVVKHPCAASPAASASDSASDQAGAACQVVSKTVPHCQWLATTHSEQPKQGHHDGDSVPAIHSPAQQDCVCKNLQTPAPSHPAASLLQTLTDLQAPHFFLSLLQSLPPRNASDSNATNGHHSPIRHALHQSFDQHAFLDRHCQCFCGKMHWIEVQAPHCLLPVALVPRPS